MYYVGNNYLLCKGMITIGPHPKSALITLFIINTPVILFSIFTTKVSCLYLTKTSFIGNKLFFGKSVFVSYGICNLPQVLWCCGLHQLILELYQEDNGQFKKAFQLNTQRFQKQEKLIIFNGFNVIQVWCFNLNFVKHVSYLDPLVAVIARNVTIAF